MKTRYERALDFTLSWEGGFSDHPADHGGPTMKGITQGEYTRYRKAHGLAVQSVRFISESELQDIYLTYWNGSHAGAFEFPLAVVMFDIGVNMGLGRPVRFFQELRHLHVDGQVGPRTLEQMRFVGKLTLEPQRQFALDMCDKREAFYRRIVAGNSSQAVFMDGWMNRARALRKLVEDE